MRIRRSPVLAITAAWAGLLFVPMLHADAQPPPPESSSHCVSDNTDSFESHGGYNVGSKFMKGTACEYRSGKSMNVGLSWQETRVGTGSETGLTEAAFIYQIWDCTTNKIVLNGVKDYQASGTRLYGTSGTAGSSTIVATSGHTYKARITGKVLYVDNGGNWELSEYPPAGLGAFNSYSACYSS